MQNAVSVVVIAVALALTPMVHAQPYPPEAHPCDRLQAAMTQAMGDG